MPKTRATKTAAPTSAAPVPPTQRSDEAFKRQAVENWLRSGKSGTQISHELGLSDASLKEWKRHYWGDATPQRASSGQGMFARQCRPKRFAPQPPGDQSQRLLRGHGPGQSEIQPDPRAKHTRYRIGPVLTLIALALLAGRREIAEIARFATTLTQPQRRRLNLPARKAPNAFTKCLATTCSTRCSPAWTRKPSPPSSPTGCNNITARCPPRWRWRR